MRSPHPHVNANTIAAATLLILGGVYGALALYEGLGTIADTGAGFFPFLVSLALVVSCVTVLVRDRPRKPESKENVSNPEGGNSGTSDPEEDGGVHWWRIAGVVLAALLVPLLGATVGMIVTLSVSLVLIAKIMGLSRWSSAIVLGVGFGAVTWLIFVRWLFVPLPTGVLGLV